MERRDLEPVFDWSALDKDTRSIVQATTSRLHELERRTGEAIVEIGRGLIDTKQRLGHGQYRVWLESEFGWSHDTARNFIDVAERFGDMTKISSFAPSALYALASGNVPDSIREGFIERAVAGRPSVTRMFGND